MRPTPSAPFTWQSSSLPIVAVGVVVIYRAIVFAAALLMGQWVAPTRSFPVWVTAIQMAAFIVPSVLLLGWGRYDRRSLALGVYCLDVACTLAEPLVRGSASPPSVVTLAVGARTDAFQAFLIWYFAFTFPRPTSRGWLSWAFWFGVWLAALLGAVLAGLNLFLAASRSLSGSSWLTSLAHALAREPGPGGGDWYFTLQYALVLPLLLLMPLKLRGAAGDDRNRLWLLLGGFGLAILPIFAEVALTTFVPAYRELRSNAAFQVSRVLFFTVSIAILPVAATYATLVQHVLNVSLVLRAAARYLLTRYAAYGLVASPVVVFLAIVFYNRDRTITELLTGPGGVATAVVAGVGIFLMLVRERLLRSIDRRFFRQPTDAGATLLALSDSLRQSTTIDELSPLASAAVADAFHPERIVTSVLDDAGLFQPQDAHVPPLPARTALAQLIGAADTPLVVELEESSPLQRLGDADRLWLSTVDAQLLVPLRGPQAELLGILALGPRKGEVPYSVDDRRLLAAVGSAYGLALARLRDAAARARSGSTDPTPYDPPARECIECGLVLHADAIGCVCGAPLQKASVPQQLGSRLRFVRRIGAGAMGVVYEATDLNLRQIRAVKALPDADPAHISRLRREARAMAAASHLNLATLYGLETWGTAPLLVMQFCEAGTLSDRLRRGALPAAEVTRVGMAIADALGHLHERGVLHRDVKPSNIGFTREGDPKLLDFGLAKLISSGAPSASTVLPWDHTLPDSLSSDNLGAIRGTPAYLSPDVLSGTPPADRDDFWSLAVTLLEASTGSNPFRAATPAATVARILIVDGRIAEATASLPGALRELFQSLLDRRPTHRPSNAADFVHRLLVVQQGVTND